MSMTRESRVRLGAAAAFIIVFGGGVAVGFAFDRGSATIPSSGEASTAGQAEAEDRDDPRPSGWIIDKIEMDAEQRAEVDSVLRHYGRRMTELQKSFQPRYRALVDSTNQSLRGLLSEEQIARYDELEAERLQWRSRQNSNSSRQDESESGSR